MCAEVCYLSAWSLFIYTVSEQVGFNVPLDI